MSLQEGRRWPTLEATYSHAQTHKSRGCAGSLQCEYEGKGVEEVKPDTQRGKVGGVV